MLDDIRQQRKNLEKQLDDLRDQPRTKTKAEKIFKKIQQLKALDYEYAEEKEKERRESFRSLNDIPSGEWILFPEAELSIANQKMGHGEKNVVDLFRGTSTGNSSDFDVKTPDGARVEVKKLDPKDWTFNISKDSSEAVSNLTTAIRNYADHLANWKTGPKNVEAMSRHIKNSIGRGEIAPGNLRTILMWAEDLGEKFKDAPTTVGIDAAMDLIRDPQQVFTKDALVFVMPNPARYLVIPYDLLEYAVQYQGVSRYKARYSLVPNLRR